MREKPYKFVVRLPMSMRDQIADAAKHFRRSMNSEIISRLQRSFDTTGSRLELSEGDQEPTLNPLPSPAESLAKFQINDNNLASQSPPSNALSSKSSDRRALHRQALAQERVLLNKFRALSAQKRAALLDLMD